MPLSSNQFFLFFLFPNKKDKLLTVVSLSCPFACGMAVAMARVVRRRLVECARSHARSTMTMALHRTSIHSD